ncbi:restriction endonuclease subunit S [Hymenobacter aerophilus]|uniref:restriction endonuclease subunit S n=1 Tax=Hymenobacter aerophilus TaxID=119644 RepID=UPI0003A437DD|nr:restriction endonuclease subunit S [Hymenobacter aerophilus]
MSNETKKTALPKLRFPEFREAGAWEALTLKEISDPITEKVGKLVLPPVSISAGTGFVLQADKFGRDISGAQYKNYTLLRKGDISYNKGNSKTFPQGCVYQLKEFEQVAAPNVFISFRFKKGFIAGFYKGYFDNNFHGEQLQNFITSGARSNGLLNISSKSFFSITLPTPVDIAEQKKIAATLSSLDDLLTAQSAQLAALQAHKRGLLQGLFPAERETVPKLRFPEFQQAPEWEEKTLGEVCKMQAGKFVAASNIHDNNQADLFPCYGGNGLRGYTKTFTNDGRYSLVGRQGALCGNVMLATGKFHATEHAVVTTPKAAVDTDWLYYLLVVLNLNKYSTGAAQPGLSVQNLEKVEIKIPTMETEQRQIADCLTSLDNRITAQTQKIEALKLHKKGLMQGLFPAAAEPAA